MEQLQAVVETRSGFRLDPRTKFDAGWLLLLLRNFYIVIPRL